MNAISSDSDSSEDEENSGNKENNEDKKQQTGEKETEEEMDVDPGLSLWIVSFIKFFRTLVLYSWEKSQA